MESLGKDWLEATEVIWQHTDRLLVRHVISMFLSALLV